MQALAAQTWRRLYGIHVLATLGLITVSTVLLLVVLPRENQRRTCVRAAARTWFTLIGARPTVVGNDHLPGTPCIVVANHASYLDGIILTAVLPPRFSFVIKNEMQRVPVAGYLLRRIGSEFVARFDHRRGATDTRRILTKAKRRQSLVFFPEGTFQAAPGLQRFQKGAYLTAVRSELPLVPVVIRGSRQMLPDGRWLAAPGQLSVIIKPPVPSRRSDARTLIVRTRRSLLEDLGEPNLAGP